MRAARDREMSCVLGEGRGQIQRSLVKKHRLMGSRGIHRLVEHGAGAFCRNSKVACPFAHLQCGCAMQGRLPLCTHDVTGGILNAVCYLIYASQHTALLMKKMKMERRSYHPRRPS